MKNLLKLLIAIGIAIAPVWYALHLIFGRLAPYIASTIPAGQWHAFLGVLVYVALALFGGIEIALFVFILSLWIAGAILASIE